MTNSASIVNAAEGQPPFFAGIDLGGTNTKVGLVDDLGRTLARQSIPTHASSGPVDAVNRMARAVREVIIKGGIDAKLVKRVGIGSPGTMDIPAGKLIQPPNLPGWDYFPLRDEVGKACGLDASFANDAGAAAFGEFWVGTGRNFESLVLFTLGTGVGCGIIVHGISIDGEHSHGAECGHIIIDWRDDARMCSCGYRGHLEAYASATALVKRTREALNQGRASSISDRLQRGEELSALMVGQEAERGDALAVEIVMDTARYLGVGVVSLMHTIDPAAVVIGGAMTFGGIDSELGRQFLQRVQREVKTRALPIPAEKTEIAYASLGGDAGYIGAAGIARQDWLRKGAKG